MGRHGRKRERSRQSRARWGQEALCIGAVAASPSCSVGLDQTRDRAGLYARSEKREEPKVPAVSASHSLDHNPEGHPSLPMGADPSPPSWQHHLGPCNRGYQWARWCRWRGRSVGGASSQARWESGPGILIGQNAVDRAVPAFELVAKCARTARALVRCGSRHQTIMPTLDAVAQLAFTLALSRGLPQLLALSPTSQWTHRRGRRRLFS